MREKCKNRVYPKKGTGEDTLKTAAEMEQKDLYMEKKNINTCV